MLGHPVRAMWLLAYADMKQYYGQCDGPLARGFSYMLAHPGKQLRPMTCMMVCGALGEEPRQSYGAAVACELVHNYSLLHDDLPAMDNAAMRRGIPTLHHVESEARAILVGDGWLSDAFGWVVGGPMAQIAGYTPQLSAVQHLEMVRVLAEMSGSTRMVLGQAYDVTDQSCQPEALLGAAVSELPEPVRGYAMVNALKTGSLFAAAMMMGALAAQPEYTLASTMLGELKRAGLELGMVYQFYDDLRDQADESSSGAVRALRAVNDTELVAGLAAIKAAAVARIKAQIDSEANRATRVVTWAHLEQYLDSLFE